MSTLLNPPNQTPARQFAAGAVSITPPLVGVVPFALIMGVAAASAGIPVGMLLAMGAIIYAGSSQLVAVQLLVAGTPLVVIIFTAIIINLRHFMYSASVAPFFRHFAGRWRWLLPYFLTDETYAVVITWFNRNPAAPWGQWFYLGAGLTHLAVWLAGNAAGYFLGTLIPTGWSLDFTLPLTFIAFLIPSIKDRPLAAAALVAGVVALTAAGLPYRLGLVLAVFAGVAAGMLVEGKR